jgi:hypothetical protein
MYKKQRCYNGIPKSSEMYAITTNLAFVYDIVCHFLFQTRADISNSVRYEFIEIAVTALCSWSVEPERLLNRTESEGRCDTQHIVQQTLINISCLTAQHFDADTHELIVMQQPFD